MPVDYRIDSDRGVVLSRAWGRLGDDDLVDHQHRLRADPAFMPHMNQLFDFTEVEQVDVTADGIHRLAQHDPFGTSSRRAFLVARPVMYGLARMFEILTDEHPHELRVQFDDHESAHAWLGIDAGSHVDPGAGRHGGSRGETGS